MKKKLVEQPLAYWEEQSYMMAILRNDTFVMEEGTQRLLSSKEFTVKDMHVDSKGVVCLQVLYDKEEYEVGFYLGGVSVPAYYLYKNFLFREEEKSLLMHAKKAVTLFMKFGSNVKKSFHLQLKIALTLVPDLIGLLDESAEKMFPSKWVEMSAASKVLPSANDLFNVQAVSEKKGTVWLHTHGLCRCGIPELEILESSQEHYEQHYHLLMTYAAFLVDHKKDEFAIQKEGAYIGRLINGNPVVVTSVSWTDGIAEYQKLKLGNEKDRKNGHNSKTSIVFLYTSEEDEKNGVYRKVSIYDDLWGENPLFFFSDEETKRMKDLAKERFSYIQKEAQNKENVILLKIGLPLKEKGKFEHIWFELLEMKENKFKAKLTQEPYDVPDMHTGDEAWFTLKDVTDWVIYTKDFAVSPNNAYLLEK